jgi:hypothetical protein
MVVVKMPILSVTAWVAGKMLLSVPPRVKLECSVNLGWYEETVSLARRH